MERTPTIPDRRGVVRGLLGLAVGGAALGPRPVAAARGWCRVDPIVVIDGRLAEILIAVRYKDVFDVNGATEIVVTHPKGVAARLATDYVFEWRTPRGNVSGVGFRHGEITKFVASRELKRTERGVELEIAVLVPSRSDHRVRVEFGPFGVVLLDPETAKGRTNEWVRLATTLKTRP